MAVEIKLPRRKEPYRLLLTSDWHVGHKAHDHGKLARHLAQAEGEGWRVLLLGDGIEAATVDSKVGQRGAVFEQDKDPQQQTEYITRLLARVKLDGALEGNHDTRIAKKHGMSVWEDMVLPSLRNGRREWNVRKNKGACKYLGYGGIVTYQVGGAQTHVAVHHGRGGGGANPETNILRMRLKWGDADLYASGDIHKLSTGAFLVETPYGYKTVWWGRTGCYLKDPEYARENLYAGASHDTGSLLATLHPNGGIADVEVLT